MALQHHRQGDAAAGGSIATLAFAEANPTLLACCGDQSPTKSAAYKEFTSPTATKYSPAPVSAEGAVPGAMSPSTTMAAATTTASASSSDSTPDSELPLPRNAEAVVATMPYPNSNSASLPVLPTFTGNGGGGGADAGGGRLPGSAFSARPSTISERDFQPTMLLQSMVQSLFSEPYETVYADPPLELLRRQIPVRNLNTGEVRYLDEEFSLLTASFQQGEPATLPPSKQQFQPWRKWWADKRRKDKELLEMVQRGTFEQVAACLRWSAAGDAAASPDSKDDLGRTALHLAARRGDKVILKELLAASAKVEARASNGQTALSMAAQYGHLGAVRLLAHRQPELLAASDEDKNIPLHLAAVNGHAEVVSHLLHADSCPEEHAAARNNFGQTPLASASTAAVAACLEKVSKSHDSYAGRSSYPNGTQRRNARADHVSRLLNRCKQPPPDFDPAADPAWASEEGLASASPMASPTSTRRSRGTSFGMRSPKTPGQRSTRRSFAIVDTSSVVGDDEARGAGPSSFEVVSLLGRGSFGEVYKVKHKATGELYAMKVLQKHKIQSKNLQRYAMSERNILSYMRHPYIVSLHYAFQTASCLVMVLEFCPRGNLQSMINRDRRLHEEVAQLYTAEVLLALCHLHERRIIFRDLKPDNIVLDEDYHAKLTDFGLSKEGVGGRGAKTFCGSVAFLAPEIVARKEHNHTVDIYDLGVLLFNMLTGLPPYYHNDRETLFANIRHARLEIPRYVHPLTASLIASTMNRDPTKRLGAARTGDVMHHAYFQDVDFDALMRREVPMPEQVRSRGEGRSDVRGAALFRQPAVSPFGLGGDQKQSPDQKNGSGPGMSGATFAPFAGWDYATTLPKSLPLPPPPRPPESLQEHQRSHPHLRPPHCQQQQQQQQQRHH